MLDKVQITISAYTFERLCRVHNKWKENNTTMAEQDLNYVINRLLDKEIRI